MIAMSSVSFEQDFSIAMKAAQQSPVVITDAGRPAYVLMTYTDYKALRGPEFSVADALAMPVDGDFDTEFPRVKWGIRDIDLD